MCETNGPSRGSRGARFSQKFQWKMPDLPGATGDHNNNSVTTSYANRPQLHPKDVIAKYKEGDIHPVSTLYELASVLQCPLELKETVTPGNTPGFFFAFCVLVDGVTYKTGMGITKKEARRRAAELALRDLLPLLEADLSAAEPAADGLHNNPQNEQMSQAVQQLLSALLHKNPEVSACATTVAAFLLQSPAGCEVVALGTGSINTNRCATSNGRVLHDSHAVVVARRSLMRFLYRHLLMFFSKKESLQHLSIFQPTPGSPLLAMKSDLTLHLYLNQLPKGAAQMPPNLRLNPHSLAAWEVINQLSLHLVVEGKVFSMSTAEPSVSRIVSMSATDKLTQWQVLGYQGALLSHLVEPLYAHSILVGDGGCSTTRGLALAVSQRAEGVTGGLPLHYCMVRPHYCLAPAAADPGAGPYSTQQNLSMNWSQGDSAMEVVDGLEGMTVKDSPFRSGPGMASRLCKAAMLNRFNLVVTEAERRELLSTVSYREAKMRAKLYQEAKNMLKVHLSKNGYGDWPSKLPHSGNFNT
ncbi:unnamed protein product [Lota lota]